MELVRAMESERAARERELVALNQPFEQRSGSDDGSNISSISNE